jgi:hypothetical protein
MVTLVRHRSTKEAANRYAGPTATAPHLYSTPRSGRAIIGVAKEIELQQQDLSKLKIERATQQARARGRFRRPSLLCFCSERSAPRLSRSLAA